MRNILQNDKCNTQQTLINLKKNYNEKAFSTQTRTTFSIE